MIQFVIFVAVLGSTLRPSDARTRFGKQPPQLACCEELDRVCCDGACFPPGTAFFAPCESNLCGCPDEEYQAKCCAAEDRVCCDGQCHPPGTNFFAPCKSDSCGCPDEPEDDCCPPDHYCCNSGCSHNSVFHVWCGPPDAPSCCDVQNNPALGTAEGTAGHI